MVQDGCFRGRMDLFQLTGYYPILREIRVGTQAGP